MAICSSTARRFVAFIFLLLAPVTRGAVDRYCDRIFTIHALRVFVKGQDTLFFFFSRDEHSIEQKRRTLRRLCASTSVGELFRARYSLLRLVRNFPSLAAGLIWARG